MRASPAAPAYAGSAACGKCHRAEYESQSKTGHARALAQSAAGQPGQWAFGSGRQAITFVSRLNEADYLEHGETWFRASNSFGITPGHQNRDGLRYRVFDPSAGILRCFACHSTGPLGVTQDGSIVPNEMGVRCEDCHGPGAAHAANPNRIRPANPGRQNGVEMNRACGACHRVLNEAEDGTNLMDPWNSRHQPLLLAASACFQKSGGRLSCISCHAAHQALKSDEHQYDAACRSCHPNVAHRVRLAGEACATCHMPRVHPTQELAFANHRIAVYSSASAMVPMLLRNRP